MKFYLTLCSTVIIRCLSDSCHPSKHLSLIIILSNHHTYQIWESSRIGSFDLVKNSLAADPKKLQQPFLIFKASEIIRRLRPTVKVMSYLAKALGKMAVITRVKWRKKTN